MTRLRALVLAGLLLQRPAFAADAPPAQLTEEPVAGEKKEAPVTAAPKAEGAPQLEPEPPPLDIAPAAVTEPAPKQATLLRSVSYLVLGASVITAGTGIYFGANAAGARSQLRMDAAAGTFTAQQLDQRNQVAVGQDRLANGLFITAAAVGLVGIVLFILGS